MPLFWYCLPGYDIRSTIHAMGKVRYGTSQQSPIIFGWVALTQRPMMTRYNDRAALGLYLALGAFVLSRSRPCHATATIDRLAGADAEPGRRELGKNEFLTRRSSRWLIPSTRVLKRAVRLAVHPTRVVIVVTVSVPGVSQVLRPSLVEIRLPDLRPAKPEQSLRSPAPCKRRPGLRRHSSGKTRTPSCSESLRWHLFFLRRSGHQSQGSHSMRDPVDSGPVRGAFA